jgi:hypothetical protein
MNTESQNSNDVSRRNGNVARLPKPIRDKVNAMLEDGVTYADLITALGDHGKHLHISNISRWKDGGYQDYLRNQSWRERIDAKADRYLEIGLTDGAKLAAGGLYAAAIQICELMDELATATPGETDADKCSRVTNSLSRLSRSILMLQQYRDALERQKAAELKLRDPNKPFGDEDDHRAVVEIVDKVLGLGRYTKARNQKIQPPAQGEQSPGQPLDNSQLNEQNL